MRPKPLNLLRFLARPAGFEPTTPWFVAGLAEGILLLRINAIGHALLAMGEEAARAQVVDFVEGGLAE